MSNVGALTCDMVLSLIKAQVDEDVMDQVWGMVDNRLEVPIEDQVQILIEVRCWEGL